MLKSAHYYLLVPELLAEPEYLFPCCLLILKRHRQLHFQLTAALSKALRTSRSVPRRGGYGGGEIQILRNPNRNIVPRSILQSDNDNVLLHVLP